MNEITITLPAIDESIIANLETLTTEASSSEAEAIKALREKYAPLAKHNGYVQIAWTYRGDGSNWREERDYYYKRDSNGKRVRAFKVYDGFDRTHTSQHTGARIGDRLYLLETGHWLRIERTGNWSQWQGAAEGWSCGAGIIDRSEYDDESRDEGGSIRIMTDAEVETEYELSAIVEGLAESLKSLAEKLPGRLTRVQQRVELATQLLTALSA
jgi:hypothetical protein